MAEEYSIAIALVDFIPTFLFPLGVFFFQEFFKTQGYTRSRLLWIGGGFFVFLGGLFKAIWKLNMALTETSIAFLTDSLFVVQSIGFTCLFIGTLFFIRQEREKLISKPTIPLTAMALWKVPFMAIQTLTCLGTNGLLVYYAFQNKNKKSAYLLIGNVIIIFLMAGLGSTDLSMAIQWVAELTNTLGQICFSLAGYLFMKDVKK
ncbi:hypothetical protein NEF87_003857 [Candidatus Lokiarchaeum ossiferum]|uniref:Intracellular septation protein A n=1 Tax=Candidatus Lokiarchaeum ossiferum TaxID=2951803 RepID=A0ABY6HZ14_9ARCH|nr:hypothetical protein NEF87_003857 [Candidatus Lokiarchaeum sp. B-35]